MCEVNGPEMAPVAGCNGSCNLQGGTVRGD